MSEKEELERLGVKMGGKTDPQPMEESPPPLPPPDPPQNDEPVGP